MNRLLLIRAVMAARLCGITIKPLPPIVRPKIVLDMRRRRAILLVT